MRTGNGRHRRPRQVPAVFLTAGVTGAGLALPLLTGGGAQAADTGTWDRVAQCESGGLWSADTDNGYYGGLQFTQDTWEEYGGRAYAPSADLASRAQQIAVAEKVLAAKGPEAWPGCATNAGLDGAGAAADVDPGGPESGGLLDPLLPAERDSGRDSGRSADVPGAKSGKGQGKGAEEGSEEASANGRGDGGSSGRGHHRGDRPEGGHRTDDRTGDRTEAAPSSPSAEPTAGTETGSGSGRHRGTPAEGPQERTRNGGRHASRDGGSDRADRAADGDYTVRPGDSLSEIAQEHALTGGWPALYDANERVVGDDPDLILPGQRLDLGASQG
ncbi:transglycosylase family protein [Streptomyces pathocidini]|uniref:LysM peptidoglycan-binding domain-containing protein n=1 Tax=Streptomyces pathocidini TaxID=1650571 RepID=UPI0033CB2AA2